MFYGMKNDNRRRDNEKLEIKQKDYTWDHAECYIMYESALYHGK